MKLIAEFVLRHRRWVLLTWLLIMIVGAGLTQHTTSRFVLDFSLPGQPGTRTADTINAEFGNGGRTQPYLLTVTMPTGQTVADNRVAIGQTFAAVTKDVPNIRIIDQATTGDSAFVTSDGRTAYAMAFYPFPGNPTAPLPTAAMNAALTNAAPSGATVGVTGDDALAVGDSSGGNGVLTEVLLGAGKHSAVA